MAGLDVPSNLPPLELDLQGDGGDKWCNGTIQVCSIIDPPWVNNLDQLSVRISDISLYLTHTRDHIIGPPEEPSSQISDTAGE